MSDIEASSNERGTHVPRETSLYASARCDGAGDGVRYPDAEEMRMVRALALLAVLEAVRSGEYRAQFRGCAVHACRRPSAVSTASVVDVRLSIALGALARERYDVAVAPEVGAVGGLP